MKESRNSMAALRQREAKIYFGLDVEQEWGGGVIGWGANGRSLKMFCFIN